MIHVREASYVHAKYGCYHCGTNADGVDFEVGIEGEGSLFICSACLKDAARLIGLGRALMRREDKAHEERQRAQQAV